MALTRRTLLGGLAATVACGGTITPDRVAPGSHELRDKIRGKFRDTLLFVPEGLGDSWVDQLVVLHDSDEEADQVLARWKPVCTERGWVGVFPRYHKPGWDEDNALLAHMMRRATAIGGCNPRRRYLVGQGAGGRRAYAMASANGFMVTALATGGAAIAVDPADLGPQSAGDPSPSILHLHGGRDERVPVGGGALTGPKQPHTAASVVDGLAPWVAALQAKPASAPEGWPEGMALTRWSAGDRHVVLAVDPEHGAGWNPRVGTARIADFLAAAPDRVGMSIP